MVKQHLLGLGLNVSQPPSHTVYDWVIEAQKKFFSLQVKTTAKPKPNGNYFWHISSVQTKSAGNYIRYYTANDFHILALVAVDQSKIAFIKYDGRKAVSLPRNFSEDFYSIERALKSCGVELDKPPVDLLPPIVSPQLLLFE